MESTVFNSDCLEGMKQYPDKWFDLAVVDPPYGIGADVKMAKNKGKFGFKERADTNWDSAIPDKAYFDELFRVSKNQIIWGGNYFALAATTCFLVWDKVQRIDQADAELAWCSFKTAVRIFEYARGNESGFAPKLKYPFRAGINIHPMQKPIALYDWIYKNYLPNGGRVIDTHLGSGSNRIAADKAGNIDFTAFEIDKDYFDAQEKRFRDYKAQGVLF